jgi:hypothetical protein
LEVCSLFFHYNLIRFNCIVSGMLLYEYFFVISGVVASYVALMVVLTLFMRLISRFSKRFSYYIAPFSGVCAIVS